MTSMVRSAADILAEAGTLKVHPDGPPRVIRWEAPPPRTRHDDPARPQPHSKHAALAADLRGRPGEWALVLIASKGSATSIANTINNGIIAEFRPSGTFEAVTRSVGAGRYHAYARYLGER